MNSVTAPVSASRLCYGGNVQANGIRQHYLRYGGKGPALVIVPGITSPAPTWGFVAEYFSHDHDTYVLDIRGRGLSARSDELDYGVNACATDLIELIKALGLESVTLMGHSMGARIALRASAMGMESVKQLMLIDPPVSGPGRRAYPANINWYTDSIAQAQAGMDAQAMKAFCPSWTLEQLQLRAEWLHTCDPRAVIESYEWFHTDDMHLDFSRIGDIPTLLMVAGKGDVIRAEDVAEITRLMPAITVAHVPSAGHMVPWDDEPGFYTACAKFLDTTK